MAAAASSMLLKPASDGAPSTSFNGAVIPQSRGSATQGDAGQRMPYPALSMPMSKEQGGEPGAISNQVNAPSYLRVQHYSVEKEPMETFSPNEFLFTCMAAAVPAGSPPQGPVAGERIHLISLSILNSLLQRFREMPRYRDPAWIHTMFKPFAVAAPTQLMGFPGTTKTPTYGAATVVQRGECEVIDYFAAYAEEIARAGSVCAFETRLFSGNEDAVALTSSKYLRADGLAETDPNEMRVRMDARKDDAKLQRAAAEVKASGGATEADYTGNWDGIVTTADLPNIMYTRDQAELQSILARNKGVYTAKAYYQIVPVVRPDHTLQTPAEVDAIVWNGEDKTYRTVIGTIKEVSMPSHQRARTDILFPGPNAAGSPNFSTIGLLKLNLRITTA